MKKLINLVTTTSLLFSSSCAFLFNKKEVDLSISSNPPGANIIIDGRNYGQTPKIINIIPKNYDVSLRIPGYGSTNVKLQTWQAIREKKGEGGRCLADALGTMILLPMLSYWSVYCRDFKQKDYLITIPQNESGQGRIIPNENPMPIGSQIPFNPYPNPYQPHQQTYNPYQNYQNQNNQIPNRNFQNQPSNVTQNMPNMQQGNNNFQQPSGFNNVGQNLYRDSYRENFDPKNATFDQNRAPQIPEEIRQILNQNNDSGNPQYIEEMYQRDMQKYNN